MGGDDPSAGGDTFRFGNIRGEITDWTLRGRGAVVSRRFERDGGGVRGEGGRGRAQVVADYRKISRGADGAATAAAAAAVAAGSRDAAAAAAAAAEAAAVFLGIYHFAVVQISLPCDASGDRVCSSSIDSRAIGVDLGPTQAAPMRPVASVSRRWGGGRYQPLVQ